MRLVRNFPAPVKILHPEENPVKTLQLLKLPLSAMQVFTGAKSFVDNPLLGSRWLNSRGLHRWRCRLAQDLADWRRRRLADRLTAQDRAALDRDGIVIKPDFLPAADFERLRREIYDHAWDTVEMRQGPTVTRRAPLDRHGMQDKAPTLQAFVNDRTILDLLRYAAATAGQPLFALQTIIADPGQAGDDPQTLPHQDTFHSAAKAWFFLHDVGADDGPFFYVPGSHRHSPARLDWEQRMSLTAAQHGNRYHARGSLRVGNDELAAMGLPRPAAQLVRANTLVVADTSGFHGRTPSARPTLRLEVYATLRRNPFLPWLGGHVWNLPLLGNRAGSIELQASRLFGDRLRALWPATGKQPMTAPPAAKTAAAANPLSKENAS